MKGLHKYLYKYGLHDCKINNLLCENGKFIFEFKYGIYKLDSLGKETDLTTRCRMVIEVAELDFQKVYNHIEINQILNRKVLEIDYYDLVGIVEKNMFDVDINYYSYFCNTVQLKGYINNGKYEIIISDVKSIDFIFAK